MATTQTVDRVPAWTLADRLRKAREVAGLKQTDLADLTGISRASIVNYEAEKGQPRRPAMAAWAMATGVSMDWLETGCPPGDLNPEPADYVRDAQIVTLPLTQRPVADFVADAA